MPFQLATLESGNLGIVQTSEDGEVLAFLTMKRFVAMINTRDDADFISVEGEEAVKVKTNWRELEQKEICVEGTCLLDVLGQQAQDDKDGEWEISSVYLDVTRMSLVLPDDRRKPFHSQIHPCPFYVKITVEDTHATLRQALDNINECREQIINDLAKLYKPGH